MLGEATASQSMFFSIDVFGGETAPALSTDARLVGLAVSLFFYCAWYGRYNGSLGCSPGLNCLRQYLLQQCLVPAMEQLILFFTNKVLPFGHIFPSTMEFIIISESDLYGFYIYSSTLSTA